MFQVTIVTKWLLCLDLTGPLPQRCHTMKHRYLWTVKAAHYAPVGQCGVQVQSTVWSFNYENVL